jgi:hypothetical protein
MKKAPKLWRRKKGGKHVGNWFVTIKDVPVNLGTKDASSALTRRTDALKGVRKFVDDVEGAADDVVAAVAPKPSPVETVLPPPPPDPASPSPGPAAASSPPPPPAGESQPDAPPDPETWDEAVNAAAGEAGDGAPPDDVPPEAVQEAKRAFVVTVDDVLRILKIPANELAPAAVELQIEAHRIFADFFFGLELAPVPQDFMGRGALAAGYEPIIRELQLEDLKIHPGWFILAGSAMILSAQIKGAKKKPVEPLRAVP